MNAVQLEKEIQRIVYDAQKSSDPLRKLDSLFDMLGALEKQVHLLCFNCRYFDDVKLVNQRKSMIDEYKKLAARHAAEALGKSCT